MDDNSDDDNESSTWLNSEHMAESTKRKIKHAMLLTGLKESAPFIATNIITAFIAMRLQNAIVTCIAGFLLLIWTIASIECFTCYKAKISDLRHNRFVYKKDTAKGVCWRMNGNAQIYGKNGYVVNQQDGKKKIIRQYDVDQNILSFKNDHTLIIIRYDNKSNNPVAYQIKKEG